MFWSLNWIVSLIYAIYEVLLQAKQKLKFVESNKENIQTFSSNEIKRITTTTTTTTKQQRQNNNNNKEIETENAH